MWIGAHARHVEEALEGVRSPEKLLERFCRVPVERVTTVWLCGWELWCNVGWITCQLWGWEWGWGRRRRWSPPPPPPPLLVLSPSSPNLSYTSRFFLSLSTWPISLCQETFCHSQVKAHLVWWWWFMMIMMVHLICLSNLLELFFCARRLVLGEERTHKVCLLDLYRLTSGPKYYWQE